MRKGIALCLALVTAGVQAQGVGRDADQSVTMHAVNEQGIGKSLGTVEVSTSESGLVFTPDLSGLTPGLHGFHLHENGSCAPSKSESGITPAGAAGSHFDPKNTGTHGTPWGEGHLGDLPALYVTSEGRATHPVLAPRLNMMDLKDKALVIHSGGDNYSDEPKKLGGGGARVACGEI